MLDETLPRSEKFGARGFEGIIIGYGPQQSFRVVRSNALTSEKKVKITTTRDVRIMENHYPAKKYNFETDFLVKHLVGDGSDAKCGICDKFWVPEYEFAECKACRGDKRAKKHAEDITCRLNWCSCEHDMLEDDGSDDGLVETLVPMAPPGLEPQGPQPSEVVEGLQDAPGQDREPARRQDRREQQQDQQQQQDQDQQQREQHDQHGRQEHQDAPNAGGQGPGNDGRPSAPPMDPMGEADPAQATHGYQPGRAERLADVGRNALGQAGRQLGRVAGEVAREAVREGIRQIAQAQFPAPDPQVVPQPQPVQIPWGGIRAPQLPFLGINMSDVRRGARATFENILEEMKPTDGDAQEMVEQMVNEFLIDLNATKPAIQGSSRNL